ncbi:universal stress protein [Companilactobacillus sp.]|jgi:nucleotide-binding universal stress UspA family protein|uniref:universal stress protein n=2 Tax=Companilactobacillus sp. TaxID=2767905 RepID=UPI0025C300C8|nr:universal stress protein [Companilactobacillus sp.]MCH4009776.1 universal stress protein [Companilactobacillus sp.]MCH4052548.1 universal stress protein [Companilactobacillus sp.]MCH4077718.1 universal stress protein [Companilactobacillus sp.]MCH4126294.1 universal stress protein [Companilactobacillus sp.]MCI1312002.1 universal stress protein [Companilactobacillus sp.]
MSDNVFKRILVGVDDSEDSLLALKYAIHTAKEDDSELIIASILEDNTMNVYEALSKDYIHGERKDLEKHVLQYKKLAEDAGVNNVSAVVDEGAPGETIIKSVIPAFNPDLLVIGSEARKGVRKHFGSQASYMAKYADISVMIFR